MDLETKMTILRSFVLCLARGINDSACWEATQLVSFLLFGFIALFNKIPNYASG